MPKPQGPKPPKKKKKKKKAETVDNKSTNKVSKFICGQEVSSRFIWFSNFPREVNFRIHCDMSIEDLVCNLLYVSKK